MEKRKKVRILIARQSGKPSGQVHCGLAGEPAAAAPGLPQAWELPTLGARDNCMVGPPRACIVALKKFLFPPSTGCCNLKLPRAPCLYLQSNTCPGGPCEQHLAAS